MPHASRVLALIVLALAVRLAVDVATPLAPGAFVLRATGIEGVDAGNVRLDVPATPARENSHAASSIAGVLVAAVATRQAHPAPRTRRFEAPPRRPSSDAAPPTPVDLAADH